MLHDPESFVRADRSPRVPGYTAVQATVLGMAAVPLTLAWLPVVGAGVGVKAIGRALAPRRH